jgi:hypothetical protein
MAIAQLPSLRSKITRRERLEQQLMVGLRNAAYLTRLVNSGTKLGRFFEIRTNNMVKPHQMFSKTQSGSNKTRDVVRLMMIHDSDPIIFEEMPVERALPQLLQMQMNDWQPLRDVYAAYKAAMPVKQNVFLDNVKQSLTNLVEERLNSIPIYSVYHSHPVKLKALFDSVRPYFDQ